MMNHLSRMLTRSFEQRRTLSSFRALSHTCCCSKTRSSTPTFTPTPPALTTTMIQTRSTTTTHSLPPPTATSTTLPPSLDDVTGSVRDARMEDYDDVINISHDIYDGRDYLPSLFASFVRDPHMHCYVFENEGKVIGFEAACVIDGGQTLVYRGARTTIEMQGHGVMKHLRRHLIDQLTADHSVRYVAMTTSNTSGLASKPNVLKTNELLGTKAIHVFPYQRTALDKLPDRVDFFTEPIRIVSASQLCDFFNDPTLRPYLFPKDRIIINTIPYRLIEENREAIQLENPHVLVSEKLIKASLKGQSPTSGLASISTWFTCPVGICVDLELYGRSDRFMEVCNHVGQHLRHIRHLATHGQLMVPHSAEISQDVLLCSFHRFGLTPMDCPFKVQYLFEQDLLNNPL